jgi:hypothetical protein
MPTITVEPRDNRWVRHRASVIPPYAPADYPKIVWIVVANPPGFVTTPRSLQQATRLHRINELSNQTEADSVREPAFVELSLSRVS